MSLIEELNEWARITAGFGITEKKAVESTLYGRAAARIEALEAALKPFAKAGALAGEPNPYGDFYVYRPAAGDEYAIFGDHLRAAAAALATAETEKGAPQS